MSTEKVTKTTVVLMMMTMAGHHVIQSKNGEVNEAK